MDDFYLPPREYPPRPMLTVRIGVTGHRMDVIPPDGEDRELRHVIRSVLAKIQVIAYDILRQRSIK